MNERQLQDAIVEEARLRAWLVYHTFDSRRSSAGFPDLVLVKRRIIFAELKAPKGERSAAQWAWGDALEAVAEDLGDASGRVVYRLWREGDWFSGAISEELAR